MAAWTPGPDPFPTGDIDRITDFTYLDELKFVRHAKVHVDETPRSLWQLASDFGARMTVHPKAGSPYPLTVTAPRGLITDLSTVPKWLWWYVGPIGTHLEASVIHDYLYMAWTDYRNVAVRRDWRFADKLFFEGMKVSKVRRRWSVYLAVRSPIGWCVFKEKTYSLEERMNQWLPLLDPGHGRDG